jgi:hypothetical protein
MKSGELEKSVGDRDYRQSTMGRSQQCLWGTVIRRMERPGARRDHGEDQRALCCLFTRRPSAPLDRHLTRAMVPNVLRSAMCLRTFLSLCPLSLPLPSVDSGTSGSRLRARRGLSGRPVFKIGVRHPETLWGMIMGRTSENPRLRYTSIVSSVRGERHRCQFSP